MKNFRAVSAWSEQDVATFLRDNDVNESTTQVFIAQNITGKVFIDLTEEDLTSINITFGMKKLVLAAVNKAKAMTNPSRKPRPTNGM